MCDREYAQLVIGYGVDDRVWKAWHDELALFISPQGTQQRVTEQAFDRMLEFAQKRLRQDIPRLFLVVGRRIIEVLRRFQMQRVVHAYLARIFASASGPEII